MPFYMKKNLLLTLLCAVFALTAQATDDFRQHRWESFEGLMPTRSSIVFLGNSITNMHDWWEAFGGEQAMLNRGTSGGFTYEALDHLETVLMGHPAKVFIGIGTNDITAVERIAETADNIRIIAERIRCESPETEVYIQSLLPSTWNTGAYGRSERVAALNRLLMPIAARLNQQYDKVHYVDLYGLMVGEDGVGFRQSSADLSLAYDNLHPTVLGYGIWCDAISEAVGRPCVYDVDATTLYDGGLINSTGDRITCFAQQPVGSDDILIIGDELVSSGEWHEWLQSPHVKNRGLGWGYTGSDLAQAIKNAPLYFKHPDSKAPRAIVIYAGVSEAEAGLATADFSARYQRLIDALREQAPESKLYLLTPLKTVNSSANALINAYNAALLDLQKANSNVAVIDATSLNDEPKCYFAAPSDKANYLTAYGYARLSELMASAIKRDFPSADITAVSVAQCESRKATYAARKVLGDALTRVLRMTGKLGGGIGDYSHVDEAAFYARLEAAYSLLRKDNPTLAECQTAKEDLLDVMPEVNAVAKCNEEFVVFNNAESNIPYRIPAVAQAANGDLVFVCDYRYSGKDIGVQDRGRLDLRYRVRHSDGIWGKEQTLAACQTGTPFVAFGDPCIVCDSETGRLMVTSCCGNVSFPDGTHDNHQGWSRWYSTDDGKTWDKNYTELADQIKRQVDERSNATLASFFIGSGKITQSRQIKEGQYYRLYCASNTRINTAGAVDKMNYVWYSDDFGQTWTMLGHPDDTPIDGGDEPKVEELPDGSVVISSRDEGRIFNIFHYTDTKTAQGTWGTQHLSARGNNGCFGATCNGEILIVPVRRTTDGVASYLALQSVPMSADRINVGIYYKELQTLSDYRTGADLAADWTPCQISSTSSAYSTMCLMQNGHIAFFYEENGQRSGYDMVFKDLDIATITGGRYTYADLSEQEHTDYLRRGATAYCAEHQEEVEALGAAGAAAWQDYVTQPTRSAYERLNRVLATFSTTRAEACPYASPEPQGAYFGEGSTAYTLQIASRYYITAQTMMDDALYCRAITRPNNANGYWVITGDKAAGYQLRNVGKGSEYVLGVKGGASCARFALYPQADIPEDVNTRFDCRRNMGKEEALTFFLHGTDCDAWNVRHQFLALWRDARVFDLEDCAIAFRKANYDFPVNPDGLTDIEAVLPAPSVAYDVSGRRANAASPVKIASGRKVINHPLP